MQIGILDDSSPSSRSPNKRLNPKQKNKVVSPLDLNKQEFLVPHAL